MGKKAVGRRCGARASACEETGEWRPPRGIAVTPPAAASPRFYRRLPPFSGSGRWPAGPSSGEPEKRHRRRATPRMACPRHPDASLRRLDASLMGQDASLIDRDASLMRQDASLMRRDASLSDQDASRRRPGSILEAWAAGRRDQPRRAKSWPTRRECAARSNPFGSKSSPSHSLMWA